MYSNLILISSLDHSNRSNLALLLLNKNDKDYGKDTFDSY
jgi:hypothetical protein